jgi:hypothetical protein
MNNAQKALVRALEQIRDFKTAREGYAYSGAEDFVLRHGEWFDPIPLPEEYDFGPPKLCYASSLILADIRMLTYVEGFAMLADIGLPILHAWNVDEDGRLIDTTWRAIDNETGERRTVPATYLGVRFSLGRAEDACWNGDTCILDDWMRDFPIFREPWEGEDWEREWPETELAQLKQRVLGT